MASSFRGTLRVLSLWCILNALLASADIRVQIDGVNDEGEAHDPIEAPEGSIFTSLPIGCSGDTIAAYWTEDPKNDTAEHAFIMLHGKLRDGGDYWTTMNNILQDAVDNDFPGANSESIIVAPQFFSKMYNSGQYTDQMLAWEDTNGWQAGDQAIHPDDTSLTSFDALDAFAAHFNNRCKYPNMKNITFVGHGGGAQLNQRYAAVAKTPKEDRAHIRYIHGDPSSCAYFTRNRPQTIDGSDEDLPKREDCEYYNTWRYGFDEFNGTADGLKTAKEYFQQYISRDVVSIVGYEDTKTGGDTYCMARMQGGDKRRDRNLAWWQYINGLARTDEDLTGFPAEYDTLPDWSDVSDNTINVRLAVVEGAGHDAEAVFGSDVGRSALFSAEVEKGWRPSSD